METEMITIPFKVELAKKIQAGEHPGKIVTRDGKDAIVVFWDLSGADDRHILAVYDRGDEYQAYGARFLDGRINDYMENDKDLVLKVPEWTQYKEGDVLACEDHTGPNDYCKWFAILKGEVHLALGKIDFSGYASYDYDSTYEVGKLAYDESFFNIHFIRLATEEEKEIFINRLKEEDTEQAKGILKRFFGIEEKPEYKFEFLQPVLVRGNSSKTSWRFGQFTHIVQGKAGTWYHVNGGNCYLKCIPYNDQTKHLLGTTDSWEEK